MAQSSIEWTDRTDNIIVVNTGGWWCRHISPGCDHCYAEAINQNKFFGGNGLPYRGAPPTLTLRQDLIDSWARQRKPKKHFVASMTDVFGEWVPRWMILRFLDGMAAAPRQTFQLLTKRPNIMLSEVSYWLDATEREYVPPNIWLGATVENQEMADKRIPQLLQIPAVRFLSCEPLLGSIDLFEWIAHSPSSTWKPPIHWVIVGGESGPKARPMHPEWARSLRDQCQAAGVAFHFKQWGEWMLGGPIEPDPEFYGGAAFNDPHSGGRAAVGLIEKNPSRYRRLSDNAVLVRAGKKAAGRLLDDREWNEFPEVK